MMQRAGVTTQLGAEELHILEAAAVVEIGDRPNEVSAAGPPDPDLRDKRSALQSLLQSVVPPQLDTIQGALGRNTDLYRNL